MPANIPPATASSTAAGDGNTLRAEPVQAQKLIVEGAQLGATPGSESATSAAPQLCTPDESPFDTAVQAAIAALPLVDSGAVTTSAASSVVHAGGSQAAVASVVTADEHSATDVAQAGSPTAAATFTI